ncbi:MAG: hypothetical protein K1X86_00345 [Ignavibacteria bacterium]|nr:hypothetical protein [Ignavibacteria bacterium]
MKHIALLYRYFFIVFLFAKAIYANPQDSIEIQLKNSSKAYLYSFRIKNDKDLSRIFFIYRLDSIDTTINIADYIILKNRKNEVISPKYQSNNYSEGFGIIYYLLDNNGWANSFDVLYKGEPINYKYQSIPDSSFVNLKIKNLFDKLQNIITCNILYDRKLRDYTGLYFTELKLNFDTELEKFYPYWEFVFNNELLSGKDKYMYDSSVFFYKKMLETGKNDIYFIDEFFKVYIQKILTDYKNANDSTQYKKVIDDYNDLINIFENYKKPNIEEGINQAKFNILLSKYFMSSEKQIEADYSFFETEFEKYKNTKFKYHAYLILGNIYLILGKTENAKENYNIIIYAAKDGNEEAKKYSDDAVANLNLISK